MGQMPLRYKLLALMPRITWPYLNIWLAFVGADIHLHHGSKDEKRQEQLNRFFWPFFKLIGRLKLYLS
jgi:hypothetical protein